MNSKSANLISEIQIPNVTNNTTNIIINNLTYLNAPAVASGSIVEELNRTGGVNLIKNSDSKNNIIEEIQIIGKSIDNKMNNNIQTENSNRNSNSNNIVNSELIEKIQNEIKNLENIGINSNNQISNTIINTLPVKSITPTYNSNHKKTFNLISSNNINNKDNPNLENNIHQKSQKNENSNKMIERYIKKKVSPYSAAMNTSYNTEKVNNSGNNSILNNTSNFKDNQNSSISSTKNKYIINKISAASKKNGPKKAFFNTSMSFDQNNDNKNTTFDNEISKKYDCEKSDEKNISSISKNGSDNPKKDLSSSEIANAIKANNPIIKNNKNVGNNNENYLIKKAVNKKFDTIREEDEDLKINKKPISYLNYYTKYAHESKNNAINLHMSNYNADTNTNGNNSIIKKITKRIKNDSNILDQFITSNKKNDLSNSYASSPNKKNSVSPAFKNPAKSSRVHNPNNSNNKEIYTITENAFSSSLNKNRINTSNHLNVNDISTTTGLYNLNNTNKIVGINSATNNKDDLQNNFDSNNRVDILNNFKKIRQKNISVPNAHKLIPVDNNNNTSKFKKINNSNISRFINNNNSNINPLAITSLGYSFKSPLKKPPVSTSVNPKRNNFNVNSKNKNCNLNLTGNNIVLNGSACKNKNVSYLKSGVDLKINNKMNLNITTNIVSPTLVTEDNSVIPNKKYPLSSIKKDNEINKNIIKNNNIININQNSVCPSKNKFSYEGILYFKNLNQT